ncbi:hypothetical protein CMUS01_07663 [Colletotrichum musicola]|uniref:Uncharacterized protein n=1 Tax=Colletotrichum musicola TaxID=2175873 RepID=A0A8H6KH53_9PEZI|nr:hypothetical protein CMUS01_07663 [Colletotrichum musicola]
MSTSTATATATAITTRFGSAALRSFLQSSVALALLALPSSPPSLSPSRRARYFHRSAPFKYLDYAQSLRLAHPLHRSRLPAPSAKIILAPFRPLPFYPATPSHEPRSLSLNTTTQPRTDNDDDVTLSIHASPTLDCEKTAISLSHPGPTLRPDEAILEDRSG